MREKMKIFFKIAVILTLSLLSFSSYAQNSDEMSIRQFFLKKQSVMNSRYTNELKDFFNFYIDSSARFVKASYLIDPNNTKKVIAQENLSMGKEEYIAYLQDIIRPLSYYYYKTDIKKITLDPNTRTALVSFSVDEYSIEKTKEYDDSNDQLSNVSYVTANCNMNFDLSSGDSIILSSNCAEKIVRKKQPNA